MKTALSALVIGASAALLTAGAGWAQESFTMNGVYNHPAAMPGAAPVAFCEGSERTARAPSMYTRYDIFDNDRARSVFFRGVTLDISEDGATLTPFNENARLIYPEGLVYEGPCPN